MKCKQCHKELLPWLEGSLSQEETAAVEGHLAACSVCRGYAEYLRASLALAAAEKEVAPDPWFYARVIARLEKESTPVTPKAEGRGILQPVFFSLLLVMGILLGIHLGSLPYINRHDFPYSGQVIPQLNEMDTEPLEIFLMQ